MNIENEIGPPCRECGEPCVDAGPGLGWQCVSDSEKHQKLVVIDCTDPEKNRLREELAAAKACPRPLVMGEHACQNRKQCWEPCGDLGKHEEYQRAVTP